MYMLLLVFGGLLGAAGVVLAGSGMSLRDGTFDAAILTPGIVAAAGGLLLIGLGAGLRTLQRIERTLATRPMPRAHAVAEGANVAESVEPPRGPAIPFAPKIGYEAQPGLASRDVLADKSPAAPGANKISPPIPAPATAAVADANVETVGQPSGKKNGNGAAGVPLRLSATLQRPSAGERQSEPAFEALWPKGPHPSRALDGASIAQSTGANADPFATKHRCTRCGGIFEQSGQRRGIGAQVGRCQRYAVYALFRWLDRSTVAGGHAPFRFDHRIAQSHRTKRLKIKVR